MLNWCHLESLFWISTLHIFLWYRTIHVCRLWTNSSVCTAAQLLTAWAGKAWTSNCEPARFQFQSGLSDTHLSICVCVWPRPLQPKSFEKGLAHEAGLKSYRGRWVSASKKIETESEPLTSCIFKKHSSIFILFSYDLTLHQSLQPQNLPCQVQAKACNDLSKRLAMAFWPQSISWPICEM